VNRLAVRLALAMAAVVIAGIVVVAGAQLLLLRQQFGGLPVGLRSEIAQVLQAPAGEGAERLARIDAAVDRWLDDPALRDAIFHLLVRGRDADAQRRVLLAAAGAIALGVLVAALIAARIAHPIAAVASAADRVAAGDLHARVRLNVRGRESDEVTRLQVAFNAMAQALERSEANRQALVADVAHELRTPLAVLQGRLEGLLDGVLRNDRMELERLHRHAALLARLVEDLRVLSLADAQRLTLSCEPLDLWGVVAEGVGMFEARAAERGVALAWAGGGVVVRVQGDRHRLLQVFGNLLENALAVTPAGGTVRVRVERSRHDAHVSFEDEGPGLPPGDSARLFERFYRTDPARARVSGGSGIGLAIVKTLCEAHGGEVRAGNRAEGGARVEVVLPLASVGRHE
jgi:two-component system, OmpR family, sensor histidine kinase BaeS